MRVIDSHTEGEPTRVIVSGVPDPGRGPLRERAAALAARHGDLCKAVVLEPRGNDAMVGALLVEPFESDCAAGVIYFNTVANLGMCGHATIGLAATLAHMGRIAPGVHRIDTPVGVVEVTLHDANTVSVVNVESHRLLKDVIVDVPGIGPVSGDVAWGGNWFFLVKDSPVPLDAAAIPALTDASLRIRGALDEAGITGRGGAWIDHIELFGPPTDPQARARSFVLCPGGAYDRSPCGTGSSAKLACLAADGLLAPGEDWIQESIIGTTYRLRCAPGPTGGVIATITGRAFVTGEAELIFNPADPFAKGIRL